MPDVTVVIPARNEGALLDATLSSLARTRAGASFDVVVVDDGSVPPVTIRPLAGLDVRYLRGVGFGAAGARNRGAAIARADAVCFCDAHLGFTPGWLRTLLSALQRWDAVCPAVATEDRPEMAGYGFTWTARFEPRWLGAPAAAAEVPFLPGACLLVRRPAFQAVHGFDAGLLPWGHEDIEISLALWSCGFSCAVEPGATVRHHFRRRHPYLVTRDEVNRNLLRVGHVHLGRRRFERLAAVLRATDAQIAEVVAAAASRRAALMVRRVRDDDWLCARFALPV